MEMRALLWKIMTWCHDCQITLKSQAHSRVPQCDGLPSIQSNKQNGHCIHRCSNSSVKWFILHVDLFATHLNHKVPLYVSPVLDHHAWDIDALNIIWSGLTAYAYPPVALLHMVIQNQAMQLLHCNNPRLARDALVLGPCAALNRDPTPLTSVNNTSQPVPQPSVSKQSTTFQPPRLVSRNRQLQDQGCSVEVAERIAAPQRSSTRAI